MTRSILRAVLCGVILGAMAFFVPKLLVGLFILGFILKAMHCCGYGHRRQRMFYMADKIRKMSDEEYAEFKTNMAGGGCCSNGYHHHGHCCGGSMREDKECCKSKKDETKSN